MSRRKFVSDLLSVLIVTVLLTGVIHFRTYFRTVLTMHISVVSSSSTLKESIELLVKGQIFDVPPGYYNSTDCGINISADDVTIRASRGKVSIDCAGEDRHFIVEGNHVQIEGLTLLHGGSQSQPCTTGICPRLDGGCLLILGTNTVITDSVFIDCTAVHNGGAISIFTRGSSVLIKDVTIFNCTALRGGGVWSDGLLTVEDSNFSQNTADIDGGAIFLQGPASSLSAQRTFFGRNSAVVGCGGGIALRTTSRISGDQICGAIMNGGTVTLTDGVAFHENTAGYTGGAVYAQEEAVLIVHGAPGEVHFWNNSAGGGGAVHIRTCSFFAFSGRANLSGNYATDGDCGALYVSSSTTGSISGDVVFEGNVASEANWGYGGAIFVSYASDLDISGNVSFISNLALSGAGGALYAQYSTVSVTGMVAFRGNVAYVGGAATILGPGTLRFDGDVQLVGNQAMNLGGAVYAQNEGTFLEMAGNVTIAGNTASAYGGALCAWTATISVGGNATLTNNSAVNDGGAISLFPNSWLDVSGSAAVRSNKAGATAQGGGVASVSSQMSLRGGCIFAENVAGAGGAISLRHEPSPIAPVALFHSCSYPSIIEYLLGFFFLDISPFHSDMKWFCTERHSLQCSQFSIIILFSSFTSPSFRSFARNCHSLSALGGGSKRGKSISPFYDWRSCCGDCITADIIIG